MFKSTWSFVQLGDTKESRTHFMSRKVTGRLQPLPSKLTPQ